MSQEEFDLQKWWGKTGRTSKNYHPLLYHSVDVAYFTELLWEERISGGFPSEYTVSEDLGRALTKFLGFVHDFGKFSECFQALDEDLFENLRGRAPEKDPRKHQPLGWALWLAELKEEFFENVNTDHERAWKRTKFLTTLGQITYGHHGSPIEDQSSPSMEVRRAFLDGDVEEAIKAFRWGMETYLGSFRTELSSIEKKSLQQLKNLSWTINGVLTLADWLASDVEFIPWDKECSLEGYRQFLHESNSYSILHDKNLTKTPSPSTLSFRDLFPQFERPTNLQEWADSVSLPDDGPGLYVLEDSTGSGKTEAALTLAGRLIASGQASGIYFGLPTMATSNAMFGRFFSDSANSSKEEPYERYFCEDTSPRITLAHSKTREAEALSLVDESVGQSWLSSNRKLSLLADIGVGTIDQALVGILPVYHHTLRLLGLREKVLIVDEVHDYAPYTNKLLERIISVRARLGLSTILLSATISNRRFSSFVDAFQSGFDANTNTDSFESEAFPRASRVTHDKFECTPLASSQAEKAIQVEIFHGDDEIVRQLELFAEDGKCVAWIRNTVDDAVKAYEKLTQNWNFDTTLFHSRFSLGDRLKIEDQIVNDFGPKSDQRERAGRIIVGTQVMEQSLDVDFDVMVTDLAPMDRILQRVGRLHRHERGRDYDPLIVVHAPPWDENPGEDWFSDTFPGASYVYQKHGLLWKTMQVLRQKETLIIPQENRELIEQVFYPGYKNDVPEALQTVDAQVEGEESADATMGDFNAIQFDGGYGETRGYKEETPTRLGEERTRGRFIKYDGESVEPWNSDGSNGRGQWVSGDFSLAKRKIAGPDLKFNRHVLESAMDQMVDVDSIEPDHDDPIIVPLEKGPSGWTGTAINSDGNRVNVYYNRETGIEVETVNE